MKKFLCVLIASIFLFLGAPVFADEAKPVKSPEEIALELQIKKNILTIQDLQIKIQGQQINLNTRTLAEQVSDRIYMRGIYEENGAINLYLEHMDYSMLWKNLQVIKITKPKLLRIHLFSFGGSVFDAMAMIGLIEEIQRNGTVVEIRAKGLAASAGLILLVSGTPGYRYLDKNAMVMFHELQSFTFLKVETPTSKEDEAKVLRKIQDKVNRYITSKSKLSFEELCGKIKSKEVWYDAEEAVAIGLADKIE